MIEAMNDVVERDGNCALEGVVFAEENLIVDIAEVSWRLEGLEALTSGAGVLTFDAVLTDLRLSPRTTDRWVSYMLAQQNRRNTIDATFNASWEKRNQFCYCLHIFRCKLTNLIKRHIKQFNTLLNCLFLFRPLFYKP